MVIMNVILCYLLLCDVESYTKICYFVATEMHCKAKALLKFLLHVWPFSAYFTNKKLVIYVFPYNFCLSEAGLQTLSFS